MRFLLASDIHLEHDPYIPELPDPDTYDAVLLAGDIGVGVKAVVWADKFFPKDKPIYYTPGNHEYYRQNYNALQSDFERLSLISRVQVLAPGAVELGDNITLIAATLWSDLELDGYQELTDIQIENSIADFSLIIKDGFLFSADDCRELFEAERAFICAEIEKAKAAGRKPIVMTHFVPTQLAIAHQFLGDRLSPYFVNDCDEIMQQYELPLWIFGHSHVRLDFEHPDTGTRIVSNAFGYPHELDFPEWIIIDA